jgi:hypothetical protein
MISTFCTKGDPKFIGPLDQVIPSTPPLQISKWADKAKQNASKAESYQTNPLCSPSAFDEVVEALDNYLKTVFEMQK